MSYQDYFASCTLSNEEVLEDWRWLIAQRLVLWHVTKFGDALLRDTEDGSIHFLDVASGAVSRIANNEADFEASLQTVDNAEKWLMREVVDGQAALGMRLGQNECLSFKVPPVLGGEHHPDNFEPCSIAVHFSLAGQVHRQVKDLPPGTKITGIEIKEPNQGTQPKRPWWRFW